MSYNPILGEGSSHCIPSNVSGSNRHYYFSFQSTVPETGTTSYILDEAPQSQDITRPPFQENNKYKDCQSQTCDSIYERSKRIQKHLETVKQKEQRISEDFNAKRKSHEINKKRQEASLVIPPVDQASMVAYKLFLEENEKKEFELREQELKERMDLKFQMVSKALTAKNKHDDMKQKQRIDRIRERTQIYENQRSHATNTRHTRKNEMWSHYLSKSKKIALCRTDDDRAKTCLKSLSKSSINSTREHIHRSKSLGLLHSKFHQER